MPTPRLEEIGVCRGTCNYFDCGSDLYDAICFVRAGTERPAVLGWTHITVETVGIEAMTQRSLDETECGPRPRWLWNWVMKLLGIT